MQAWSRMNPHLQPYWGGHWGGQANLDLLHVIAYALLMRRRNPGTPLPLENPVARAEYAGCNPVCAGTLLSLENPAAKLSFHPLMTLAELPVTQGGLGLLRGASHPPFAAHVHAVNLVHAVILLWCTTYYSTSGSTSVHATH